MLSIRKWIKLVTSNLDFTPIVKTWKQIATPQGAWYVVASFDIKANSQYLIVANNGNGQGGSVNCNVNFDISGTPALYLPFASITNDGGGNYVIGLAYIKTGSSACTLKIRTYGYNTSVTNINGNAIAIPLVVGGVARRIFNLLTSERRWATC